MSLYFFDVYNNGGLSRDEFGVELDSLQEAREQAIALLPDMARDSLPREDYHEYKALVRCHRGRIRYTARLTYQGEWNEPLEDDAAEIDPILMRARSDKVLN